MAGHESARQKVYDCDGFTDVQAKQAQLLSCSIAAPTSDSSAATTKL
jgi:hypothetical protein